MAPAIGDSRTFDFLERVRHGGLGDRNTVGQHLDIEVTDRAERPHDHLDGDVRPSGQSFQHDCRTLIHQPEPIRAGALDLPDLDLKCPVEETTIRGVLYRQWAGEAGTLVAIVLGAAVFALIHLPRYGLAAMPLDAAVGLALGGLRALTGRVLPCAVAHTMADWGAWFWA